MNMRTLSALYSFALTSGIIHDYFCFTPDMCLICLEHMPLGSKQGHRHCGHPDSVFDAGGNIRSNASTIAQRNYQRWGTH